MFSPNSAYAKEAPWRRALTVWEGIMRKSSTSGATSLKKRERIFGYNTSPDRDLMGTVISDVILELQSAFAQAERDNIHQRQAEGIAAAKVRGVRFGPEPQKRPAEYEMLKQAWKEGNLSARQAGIRLGVTHKTFLKWVRE